MGSWKRTCIFTFLLFSAGCGEREAVKPFPINQELRAIEDWRIDELKKRMIFFGHASVGYNIIDGIEKIRKNDGRLSTLKIIELKSPIEIAGQGIYHSVIGNNEYPKSKIDGFGNILRGGGLGNQLGIAFFKLCYVDFNRNTDVKEVFGYYWKSMDKIKEEFPQLKIIHVTAPLYAHAWGLKGYAKSLVLEDDSNIKRNEFNKMLVDKYKDHETLYDLARVESTLPDGSRVSFKSKRGIFFSLAKEYTDDGGHLNEIGKIRAAEELLKVLCNI